MKHVQLCVCFCSRLCARLCERLCAYLGVCIILLVLVAPAAWAQTSDVFSILSSVSGPMLSPIVNVEADKLTPLTFSGKWPLACGPTAVGHEIDTVKKIVLITLSETAAPCVISTGLWEYVLPPTSFPFGRYDIAVRLEPAKVNGGATSTSSYVRTARGYFFAAIKGASIANQRLIANPGVEDAEQFLEVTTLVFCGGSKLSAATTRSGSTLEIRVYYARNNPICPLLTAPNTPVSTLLSIGKLPAGTYDAKVVNIFTDENGALTASPQIDTLQERLTINAKGITATASLNGVWYDPKEPGWGMTITENNNTAFVTWYGYMEPTRTSGIGRPFWYVMTGKRDGANIRGEIILPLAGTDFRLKWDANDYNPAYWGEAIITMLDVDNIAVTTNFGSVLYGYGVPLAIPYASVITRKVSRLKF